MSEPKRLFFDTENTRLDAVWGTCLCIGYAFNDGKVYVPKITDFKHRDILDDKELLRHFAEDVWPKADITIGHYLKYDIPFINTRLITNGLEPLAPVHPIDTWRIAKYKLKLDSNRLDRLAHTLKVKHEKTYVDPEHWKRVQIGDPKSLKYIVEHCKYDILVLREVYQKLGHLVSEPKQFRGDHQCPSCGSTHVQLRGRQLTLTREYNRFQCQSCARWSRNKTATSMELV